MLRRLGFALVCLGLLAAEPLAGQYFGQNKVRHKVLHFEVLKTKHFDIYFYPQEKAASEQAARMAERWYTRLSGLLHHVLTTRQPIILYASHTDFEQTTVVPGMIGQGTGGVTLATGRKVVVPLAGPLKETNHVLGHELVHAFQYDMTTSRRSPEPGVARLPLYFVEGMAEYLSLGADDSNTAMWLRDAVVRDKFPTLKELGDPNQYFPYRFGQAFWAYIGGRYGDDKIAPLLLAAGASGSVETALKAVLHVTPQQFSVDWKRAVLAAYDPVLNATQATPKADVVIASTHSMAGKLNVSPALSPDGKWVMFYSERSLFSINLYLADAHSGRVVGKITETAISAHFNNLEFINSAGAWARDSERFAYGHVVGGTARISIYDLRQQRVTRSYPIAGVGEVFSPTWSPDGSAIAFTAISGGLTNLYMLNTASGAVRPLTADAYAELEPAWSPDGKTVAFATDRFSTHLEDLSFGHYQLALLNVATGAVTAMGTQLTGDQTNPQWSSDGKTLYCLSNANGIPNLYRIDLATGAATALTNAQTGVSGITDLSPAFSVARTAGTLIYSAFTDNGYDLVRLPEPATAQAAGAAAVAGLPAAMLPPRSAPAGAVSTLLTNWAGGLPPVSATFAVTPYRPTLALDYVAPPSLSVGVSPYGTLLGGGTALYFSDLLGYRNLMVAFEALTNNGGSGFVRDLSAQALYENDQHSWTWGFGGGQIPFVTGAVSTAGAVVNGRLLAQEQFTTFWEMDRQAVGVLSYPFSRAQRVEFTAGYENIGFAAENETQVFDVATGTLLGDMKQNLAAPPALNFGVASAALVYDTSIFGGTSPVLGQSYRLQAGINAGSIDFATVLLDYRKYVSLARPLSLAGRLLHYGRYGAGADDPRMQPEFLGYPALVRGYDFGSFSTAECGPEFGATGSCPSFDRLLGSKIAVANLELRLELLGPLGLVKSEYIPPVELAPFFDAGVAWTSADKANFLGGTRHPVTSEGLTLRVNLLGFAVGSLSYAIPNNRPFRTHVWEFSLLPGY
ncbi:MAG: hypothetical protein ACRD1M_17370 [Terriglobales bacterium]